MTLLCGGCYVSSREEVPYTHRSRAIFITKNMERNFGQLIFDSVRLDRVHNATKKLQPSLLV